jgi:hypothetical protein
MITNKQLRAARILLGWSRAQTLLRAGVSMFVLGELERHGPGAVSDKALAKLVGCLESNGARFIGCDGVTIQRSRSETRDQEHTAAENVVAA